MAPREEIRNKVQDVLKDPEQKKQLAKLQEDVDSGLTKILTAEQKKSLKDMRSGRAPFGPPGPGAGPGPGPGRPATHASADHREHSTAAPFHLRRHSRECHRQGGRQGHEYRILLLPRRMPDPFPSQRRIIRSACQQPTRVACLTDRGRARSLPLDCSGSLAADRKCSVGTARVVRRAERSARCRLAG